MSEKSLDRRIQKTLALLQNALADLTAEKGYDDVTIQDILDRANVGRSTFYAHFENKDQLLRSILSLLNQHFEDGIKAMDGNGSYDDNSGNMPYRVVRFVEQNHRLFRAMLGKPGYAARSNPFQDYLFVLTREHFRMMLRHNQDDPMQNEMAANYYASALMGAIIWWLESDRVCSAEMLAQMMNRLTLPGIKEAFGDWNQ
jgi:AcrR family transcriptional regulator